jgi:alpha-D-xyloside xylohydrolase
VLPLGARDDVAEYGYAEGVTLVVHPGATGLTTVTIPDTTGAESAVFELEPDGEDVHVRRRRGASAWAAQLAGGAPPTTVDAATDAVTISPARG